MEYLILNELRFDSPDIVLSALTELEFSDEDIAQPEISMFQKFLNKLKKLI
jgi:hypothetical protein